MKLTIPTKKLNAKAILPVYGSAEAAGADLYACIDDEIQIEPGQTVMIPTGLAMEIPTGYAGFLYARSGLAAKRGLAPANKVGVIDSDYRGEIKVALHNHGTETACIAPCERIAQILFAPVFPADFAEVTNLQETVRGCGGFGSTGQI